MLDTFFASVEKYAWEVSEADVAKWHGSLIEARLVVATRRSYVGSVRTFYDYLKDHPFVPLNEDELRSGARPVALQVKYAREIVFAQNCNVGCYCNKYIVVVDEDIDPINTDQVIWAMCSRVDPREDVEIIRRAWSTALDPTAYPPEAPNLNSRMVIDACRPWERRESFPPVARQGKELRGRVWEEFAHLFKGEHFR